MSKNKFIGFFVIFALMSIAVVAAVFNRNSFAQNSSVEAQATLQKYVEAMNNKDIETVNDIMEDRDYTDKKLQRQFYESEMKNIKSLNVSIRNTRIKSEKEVKIDTTVKLVENTGETIQDHVFTMIRTPEGWKVLRLPGTQDQNENAKK